MRTSDFHFDLPPELIAQQPCEQRSQSRLLCPQQQPGQDIDFEHLQFDQLCELLNPEDLLVFNDTRVIPARLYGNKASGGKVEILIERLVDDNQALAHVRASKSPKPGTTIRIQDSDFELSVDGRRQELFVLSSTSDSAISEILQQAGHMPLPPYISRDDDDIDFERYQTVYAKNPGAVAAPTAGLHFDDELLSRIREKGIRSAYVTLHVGAGTFQPVRVDNIEDHNMHSESIEVSQTTVDLCNQAREKGGRIIAVGTTSLRALESASASGSLRPFRGETDIFITPGYRFNCVDALITNFHLPESTLLMLVSAFSGSEFIRQTYAEAITRRYRFFSYGDAMFLTRNT